MPPSYNELVAKAEKQMSQVGSIEILYDVTYQKQTPTKLIEETGQAIYSKEQGNISWINDVQGLEEIADITPLEAIKLMKESNVSAVEYYQEGITCNLLNGYSLREFEDYFSVRVLACLNKTTGYPEQYTFFFRSEDEGFIVSYNSFTALQQPLNNTISFT